VPIGEPTRRDLLTVPYGGRRGRRPTASATVTASRPYGVKFSACVVYVPFSDIFPKVNQITY
jgi:hypothetical protein